MFTLGPSETSAGVVTRPLKERANCAAYAAMGYWFYRWDWGEAVAFEGLDAWARASGQTQFSDFVTATLDTWIAESQGALPSRFGPGRCLLTRYEATGDTRYLDFARRMGDRLLAAPTHQGAVLLDHPSQNIFVDSLAGDPPFLAALGRVTGNEDYSARGREIVSGHCAALQQHETGLFGHYKNFDNPDAPSIAWGRGNGWAALGLVDYLIESAPGAPGRAELINRLERFCVGLSNHQIADAGWRNLIRNPSSYPETSTTVMVAAAVHKAVGAGLIDSRWLSMAGAAWAATEHRLDVSAHLVQVSYRPGVNTDPSRYEHAPAIAGAYPWAQGPYLLAAAQYFQH